MYANRFIASVRVGGQILRENQGTVTLPFGAEYELLLKNMNNRRAMASVTVDGVDVTDGTKLIIRPNDTISLERFIKDGNFSTGNKLKFIERTGGVESHRGIKQDDGLIRVEFWPEKEKPLEIQETIVRRRYVDDYWPWPRRVYPPDPWTLGGGVIGGLNAQESSFTYGHPQGGGSAPGQNVNISSQSGMAQNMVKQSFTASNSSAPRRGPSASTGKKIQAKAMRSMPSGSTRSRMLRSFVERSAPLNDTGITVPGSESHQQFWSAAGFPLEQTSTVIVLQLRGEVGGVTVVKPVTVKAKPKCSTCGKVNKATDKFCTECGTALLLI